MKTCKIIFAIFLLSPALFLGCGSNGDGLGSAASAKLQKVDSKGQGEGGVVRQTPAPQSSETPSLPKRFTVIATRPGSGGLEVDLTSAAVTGEVLTVALRYRNMTTALKEVDVTFSIDQVSINDDATSRRYGVLKDQSGQYMAAPLSDETSIKFSVSPQHYFPGSYEVAWFKFPAPPAQAQTISIKVPKVAPFDNVRIQRWSAWHRLPRSEGKVRRDHIDLMAAGKESGAYVSTNWKPEEDYENLQDHFRDFLIVTRSIFRVRLK
jgi:hypothetical protein